jgi:hypothetical protein
VAPGGLALEGVDGEELAGVHGGQPASLIGGEARSRRVQSTLNWEKRKYNLDSAAFC